MAAGKTGEIIKWGDNGTAIKLAWSEEYNASNNTSRVTITSCQFRSATYYGNWYGDGSIAIGDSAVVNITSSASSNPNTHQFSSNGGWQDIQGLSGNPVPPWYSGWISHNSDGTLSIPIQIRLALWRGGSDYKNDTISQTEWVELTTIPQPRTVTFSADPHSSVTVTKNGTPLSSGATVYYGDTLKVTFGANAGYKATATLNGSPITSGINHTVTGDVSIAVTAEAQGLVYIDTGTQFEAAQIFIDGGSEWEQYMPYIDNGAEFELYT